MNSRLCAVNGCEEQSAGLATWPDDHTRVELCGQHAVALGVPHSHEWRRSDFVIDTYPETLTWFCDCGIATHDPETGRSCGTGHFGQPV